MDVTIQIKKKEIMNKLLNILVWVIAAIPGLYLFLNWDNLPASIAIHFNLHGEADKFGNKNELLVLVAILSGISLITYYIYRIDPKRHAAENKSRLQRIGFAIAVFLVAIACLIIHSAVNSKITLNAKFMLSLSGLLFAIMGNYMSTIKPNYFAGIRLPWTLENADNWKKTHALAGRLWFGGGLFVAIICLFLPPVIAFVIFFVSLN